MLAGIVSVVRRSVPSRSPGTRDHVLQHRSVCLVHRASREPSHGSRAHGGAVPDREHPGRRPGPGCPVPRRTLRRSRYGIVLGARLGIESWGWPGARLGFPRNHATSKKPSFMAASSASASRRPTVDGPSTIHAVVFPDTSENERFEHLVWMSVVGERVASPGASTPAWKVGRAG